MLMSEKGMSRREVMRMPTPERKRFIQFIQTVARLQAEATRNKQEGGIFLSEVDVVDIWQHWALPENRWRSD